MKLIVPHVGELLAADARLIRLAQFLGISCEPLLLDNQVQQRAEYVERATPDQSSCLVINPKVMREWVGGSVLPDDLVSCLVSRFRHVLVHGLTSDPFIGEMVATLSGGRVRSVEPIADTGQPYQISSSAKDFCGPFTGLSFGPINSANDHVLAVSKDDPHVRGLIWIGGRALAAAVKRDKTEITFLAGEDIADVDTEVGDAPLREYFSRFLPYAMALRHIFGEECWQPSEPHAAIIIDDPLLRRDYGYLNFDTLLHLMQEHNFHTTIAFIPHNYRRNSARIVKMFLENPNHFAICFHGNDHTKAEFASSDTALLNTMLGIAERRMKAHEQTTGLHCDRVMVFPQGGFSVEAMEVLRSRNFYAVVNTVLHPMNRQVPLTIADLAQPAVLRYGGFPLFTRTYVQATRSEDVAFNVFFGRPVFIVEHHDVFRRAESLAEVASMINSIAPEIHWSNLETAVMNSALKRRTPDGLFNVRAYSGTVRITNDGDSIERFSVEWSRAGQCSFVEQVLRDGAPDDSFAVDDSGIGLSVDMAPRSSQTLSVMYGNEFSGFRRLGLQWEAKAFLRRRLSEVRDNYVSKNQHLLTIAKTLQRRFLS
jgi:hypothetical protein